MEYSGALVLWISILTLVLSKKWNIRNLPKNLMFGIQIQKLACTLLWLLSLWLFVCLSYLFTRFIFLTLQVSDNNLFYLEAIHNFVEVSHDDESNFWPWRIKYFQNLPITSKHMHNSYELSDFLEHKHVMWSNPPFLPIPEA